MLEKTKKFWNDLNRDVTVNGQKLALMLAVCALAGIAVGTFLSPNVDVTIGSNNCIARGEAEDETEEEA